jgi:hypothetical protein
VVTRQARLTTTELHLKRGINLGFKAPPQPSRVLLALRGLGSTVAGWRDGRLGLPHFDDRDQPPHVKRRVAQANAFIGGPLRRQFRLERNRLRNIWSDLDASLRLTSGAPRPQHDPPILTIPDELLIPPEVRTDRSAPSAPQEPDSDVTDRHAAFGLLIPRLRDVVYFDVLAAIFGCEGFINKKAFELFAERDLYLWFMVSGLAAAIVTGMHLLGRFWKKRDYGALTALVAGSILLAGTIASMRYLAIDHARQKDIRTLRAQIGNLDAEIAQSRGEQKALEKRKKLSPADRQSLVILKGRIAQDSAQITASRIQLDDAKHPQGIDRPLYGIPVFAALNLFLMVVAAALSYYLYDPEAQKAKRRRDELRELLAGGLIAVVTSRRRRKRSKRERRAVARDAARLRRDRKRAVENIERENTRRRQEHDETRTRRDLEEGMRIFWSAGVPATEAALEELAKAYSGACIAVQQRYVAIIDKYWTAQNRRAKRRATAIEKRWLKAVARGRELNQSAPVRPDDIRWRRPEAQAEPLVFAQLDDPAP